MSYMPSFDIEINYFTDEIACVKGFTADFIDYMTNELNERLKSDCKVKINVTINNPFEKA